VDFAAREPWDADGLFYVSVLLVADCLAGLLPSHLWTQLGVFVGQL
jgi:hypothetical protein